MIQTNIQALSSDSRHHELILMDAKVCCDLAFGLFIYMTGFMLYFVV